jgi:hypothetical protein
MDRELEELLERARAVNLSDKELLEQRIMLAAANGRLSDERITVEAMRASVTIIEAADKNG